MKAVLVMPEMPEKCIDCTMGIEYLDTERYFCAAPDGNWIEDISKKPDWCPLCPMPKNFYYGRDCSEWDDGYQTGVAAAFIAMERSGEDG